MSLLAAEIIAKLKARAATLAVAESCTGGLLADTFVSVAGASAVFDRGFVTYSNQAKIDLLGVEAETLAQYGAVSSQVACQMADGACANAKSTYALSTTGIAGPDGGSVDKPVGLVYIALSTPAGTKTEQFMFSGDRQAIRQAAVESALKMLLESVS